MKAAGDGQGDVLRDFIDVDELLRQLGICRRTLITWEEKGAAPPFSRVGARRLYDVEEVRSWIRSRREVQFLIDARRDRHAKLSRRAAVARLARKTEAEATSR